MAQAGSCWCQICLSRLLQEYAGILSCPHCCNHPSLDGGGQTGHGTQHITATYVSTAPCTRSLTSNWLQVPCGSQQRAQAAPGRPIWPYADPMPWLCTCWLVRSSEHSNMSCHSSLWLPEAAWAGWICCMATTQLYEKAGS